MSTKARPTQPQVWLMQPEWLPAFRAGIGGMVILSALGVLVGAWPWSPFELMLITVWAGYGAFLVWASRYEKSGTHLTDDEIVVTSGRTVHHLNRPDILDIRHDLPGGRAWRVQAITTQGQTITLLGVPPTELERFRRWHVGVR